MVMFCLDNSFRLETGLTLETLLGAVFAVDR